ncbi:MAG: glycosyltransferase [Candidatus Lokiarchaeota archaeon]|nr:glycosyltransferase [Candidatus Lokiarchaeota archaeon]
MSNTKPDTISIVAPTHNRVKMLKRLLKSIENLASAPKEVIIVNDGSTDHTSEFLEKWQRNRHSFIPIKFNLPFSRGPSVARNIGIQLASSDAIAFTDDDCIVASSWLKAIKKSQFWEYKKIAGIGGRVFHFRKDVISEYYSYHRILEPPKYNQYLVTANACYLRKALFDVNGFDESHRYPGGEDNGLSFKLANQGYQFGFEKNMIVFHDYRTSLLSFFKTFFRYGKGCAEISYKYLKQKSSSKMRS